MATEPLHEIQLNGKQLVFTFMSATVVVVVVFLCGVMVGRGVRAPRPDRNVESTAQVVGADPTSLVSTTSPVSTPATSADGGLAASQENLSYPSRLEGKEPVEETMKASGAPAASVAARPADSKAAEPVVAVAPAPAREPVPSPADSVVAKPVAPSAARPAAAEVPAPVTAKADPTGDGFVVQVAATKERREADTIARRLTAKGFPAFVTVSSSGPQMFRVRVGTYVDRHQAQTIATRLEKEEQFKPWVTR